MEVFDLVFLGIVAAIAIGLFRVMAKASRAAGAAKDAQEKQEALFRATFPELQPYFHPVKVLQFVDAWRLPGRVGDEWPSPPGFSVARARFGDPGDKGRRVELLDTAGAVVTSFLVQQHAEGAVLRIQKGKMTVNARDKAVRYWHPEREFKWSRAKGWRLISALSDREIESSDRGTRFSSDTPSSSSSTATAAAAAAAGAAVAGAGGAFDGGGSSESWDDGGSDSRTSY